MWEFGVAPFTCGPLGSIKKLRQPWTRRFLVVWKLSHAVFCIQNAQAPCQHLAVHFDCLNLCPPDIHFPITVSPASPSPGNSPGESSLQPPGTTLEAVDDVNPTGCYPRHQQHSCPILLSSAAAFSLRLLLSKFYLVPKAGSALL